ncbi:hypothetical protein NFI96_028861 [Prochilodus magdalenae]|nr:hypothetical protein NFI96_028861 [Prochilodus magdalenae]
MYLCKNGVGVMTELLEQRDEHVFILRNVSVQDSGNYSCVYSVNKYSLNNVRASGQKTIQVQVTELFQRQGQRYNVDGTMEFKILDSDDWTPYPSLRKRSHDPRAPPLCTSSLKIKQLKYKHLQELKSVIPEDFYGFYDALKHDILQLLESSNPTTCPLDPIPSTLLQSISLDLLPFISSLINCSLSSGHVPQAFKTARVVPILKKPSLDSSDISSYRPNRLQDINQSGFKPAHSTETALIAVTERLHAARSAKLSSVLILLDLSAAFDTVNHKILLSVLTDFGITGTAWKWFESYLEDRRYQVAWNGSMSAPCRLSTGVPQGSVLGPLLFSLYTLSWGKDARCLGVILDGQLSFSAHITNLTRACRFLLYNIRRIRPFLSQGATQLLVQSLVISRLDYCNWLLAGLPLRAIRRLQLVQDAAARLIFNLTKFTHVPALAPVRAVSELVCFQRVVHRVGQVLQHVFKLSPHSPVSHHLHWVKRTPQDRAGLLDDSVQPLPVSGGDAAASADHSIKDGCCHHSIVEGPQERPQHSKRPESPQEV